MYMVRGTNLFSPERRPSLRLRIAISLAVLALLVVLVQSLALISLLERKEDEFIDREINDQINYSISRWKTSPEAAQPNVPDMWLYQIPPEGQDSTQESAVPPLFANLHVGNHEVYLGSKEYHVAVRDSTEGRFVLAYDVDQHESRLNSMRFFAVLTALLLGLVILIAGYLMAGRLTGRLDRMAKKLDQEKPGTFVEPAMEIELLSIARALDDLRVRQQAMLDRERAFVTNLSHELRTPLTGIRTDAELLTTLPDLPEAVARRGNRIILSVDRMNQLANSLLWLAREAKPVTLEPVQLKSAIESMWAALQLAQPKPIGLRLAFGELENVCVLADPSLLDLALRNVLENALRYSESGQIVCQLEGAKLIVRDTGPGFAEADLEHVFDRHFTGERGIHGIGLAIVQHVCTASAWSIRAANAATGGEIQIDFRESLLPVV